MRDATRRTTHGNSGLATYLNDLRRAVSGFATTGNVYVVLPAADDGRVQFAKNFNKTYEDNSELLHTTIESAYAAAVSNRNDLILISANAGHAQTSMLTIAKNRVHFQSLSYRSGFGLGARSRITMGDSTVSADIALMQNTGVGNTFTGLKFDSSSTVAASIWGVAEGGEYTIYRDCEFYKSTDLAVTFSAELLHNGDSTQYINCYFGSTANAVSTAIIHPCVELARETITGKASRDGLFEKCTFARKAGGTANAFVDATGTTDVERVLMFRDCDFVAAELGSVPAEAVTCSGGKQTEGLIALADCRSWNCTLLKEASVGIHVSGPVNTHNTSGVSKDA